MSHRRPPNTGFNVTPEPAGGKHSAERRAQTEAHNRALVAAHAAAEREGRILSPSQLNRLVKRFEREQREAAVSYVGHGPIVDRLPHPDRTANEALHNLTLAEQKSRGLHA